uniref:Predicted nucleotide-binding protein containing TIR-like domain-containing protein n=1 Tax=Candidatus Kentrum sp. LPFa TaxID=2126335 RepID=A0A450WGS6_9GAMM|nr:MAG: Predicted nucleotide-binding protein containing TIR-like domain-containing protein [Candidatus Kentron sp. LPFa]
MDRLSKKKALEHLRKAKDAISGLEKYSSGERSSSTEFKKWRRNTERAIKYTFGKDSEQIENFVRIRYFPMIYYVGREIPDSEQQEEYLSGLTEASPLLESIIEEIETYWADDPVPSQPQATQTSVTPSSKKLFIIHGRDDGTKETVARFIEKLGLEPVILHEQANKGRSIIDKFEQHAEETAFAIALLTPDDVGGLQGNENDWKSRARQNVIFELGWFLGRLERGRVCALKKGDVDEPSDWKGVLYIDFDTEGAWRMKLFQELKSAGFHVDANLAF